MSINIEGVVYSNVSIQQKYHRGEKIWGLRAQAWGLTATFLTIFNERSYNG